MQLNIDATNEKICKDLILFHCKFSVILLVQALPIKDIHIISRTICIITIICICRSKSSLRNILNSIEKSKIIYCSILFAVLLLGNPDVVTE